MKIKLEHITIRDLAKNYADNEEEGAVAYGGNLDVRPKYQRGLIYKPEQQKAVIDSINNEFPLNVMYWAKQAKDKYEILDGQQRTASICRYVHGKFSLNDIYFENLQDDEQKKILDYELNIYMCEGTDSEKLHWFNIINIAGEKLTKQEFRNAVYAGVWTADAKRYFSKNGCAAGIIGGAYMKGRAIRQEYFETVIKWISDNNIEDYMGKHQHDEDAEPIWEYFQAVIEWIEKVFTNKRSIMKGVDWGTLYNKYKKADLDPIVIEERIKKLVQDDDVTQPSGIYPYILTGNENHLSIKAFSKNIQLRVYTKQDGICVLCKEKFKEAGMEGDHKIPWSKGGKTIESNCQMLCKHCNILKSDK